MGATIAPQYIWIEVSGTVPMTNFPPSFPKQKKGLEISPTISIVPHDKSRHGPGGLTVNPYSGGGARMQSTCALVGGFEVH